MFGFPVWFPTNRDKELLSWFCLLRSQILRGALRVGAEQTLPPFIRSSRLYLYLPTDNESDQKYYTYLSCSLKQLLLCREKCTRQEGQETFCCWYGPIHSKRKFKGNQSLGGTSGLNSSDCMHETRTSVPHEIRGILPWLPYFPLFKRVFLLGGAGAVVTPVLRNKKYARSSEVFVS